ncbi:MULTISPECIES: hypothetical protein [Nostoc]|nr:MULTISPECIES: hypothetical protein [Nostoc]
MTHCLFEMKWGDEGWGGGVVGWWGKILSLSPHLPIPLYPP